MKFKIKKNVLLEALNNVSKALSSKNIIPILSGIKFELFDDKLVLTASDNDITIQSIIKKDDNIEIINTGSIVVKGKYILDIIRKLEGKFINIELFDDYKIMIYTENSEFSLNGIDIKEYPQIDLTLSSDVVSLPVSELKNMIAQTNYATSMDEARIVLTGVNIKIDNKLLECSATDSYRLALKKIILSDSFEKIVDIIIPSKNLGELFKILPSDFDGNVNMYIYNNKVIFGFENIIFQSRLISGNYPNTKNLIPNDILFNLKINRNDFYNMVDRASILNNDKDNNIITLEINDNLLKITSMSLEIGKVEEKMSVNCSENIKISFSSKYMMEALSKIKGDEVVLTFVGEIRPILLKEAEDDSLISLILLNSSLNVMTSFSIASMFILLFSSATMILF